MVLETMFSPQIAKKREASYSVEILAHSFLKILDVLHRFRHPLRHFIHLCPHHANFFSFFSLYLRFSMIINCIPQYTAIISQNNIFYKTLTKKTDLISDWLTLPGRFCRGGFIMPIYEFP